MARGAWWATVHGVVKSQTQLSNFTFTFIYIYIYTHTYIHTHTHTHTHKYIQNNKEFLKTKIRKYFGYIIQNKKINRKWEKKNSFKI